MCTCVFLLCQESFDMILMTNPSYQMGVSQQRYFLWSLYFFFCSSRVSPFDFPFFGKLPLEHGWRGLPRSINFFVVVVGVAFGLTLRVKIFTVFLALPFIWILGFHMERAIDLLRYRLMETMILFMLLVFMCSLLFFVHGASDRFPN
jgi:hypothetical protein